MPAFQYKRRGRAERYQDDEHELAFENDNSPDEGRAAPQAAETSGERYPNAMSYRRGVKASAKIVFQPNLIDGIFPAKGLAAVVGASGTGKSFVLLDMMAAITTGTPFAGHEIDRTGGVAYFCYEDEGSIDARWKGLQDKYDANLDDAPFFPISMPMPLSTDAGWDAVVDTLGKIENDCREFYGVPLVAAFIDTVHASQMVAKENDADSWAHPIDEMKRLAEAANVVIVISHHAGKSPDGDSRGNDGTLWRGSSSAPAAMDAIIGLRMDKSEGEVTRRWMFKEKVKNGGRTGYVADIIENERVVGYFPNGRAVTTLFMTYDRDGQAKAAENKAERARLKAAEKAASKPRVRTEYELPAMQAIRLVAKSECRETQLTAGGWAYVASKHAVEDRFKSIVGSLNGNASKRLKTAIDNLTKFDGLEFNETLVAYEFKSAEPIPLA